MADTPDLSAWGNVDRDEAIRQAEHFHAENLRNLRAVESLRAEVERLRAERDRLKTGIAKLGYPQCDCGMAHLGGHDPGCITRYDEVHRDEILALLDTSDDQEDDDG